MRRIPMDVHLALVLDIALIDTANLKVHSTAQASDSQHYFQFSGYFRYRININSLNSQKCLFYNCITASHYMLFVVGTIS